MILPVTSDGAWIQPMRDWRIRILTIPRAKDRQSAETETDNERPHELTMREDLK